MQLFKRVLLSLFPDEIITQNVNPASMFVSFISTKEFFSVIHRKIVENYKLNLFDVALDPFEFKVGFGDKPFLKQKQTDLYYGYCSASNLNGYRFMNPANLANAVALLTSVYLKDTFEKYDSFYFVDFLYAVYLMSFVFLGRTKIFPIQDKEASFNWFVEVFFNFYAYVLEQGESIVVKNDKTNDKKIDKRDWKVSFNALKKELLGHVDIFFMLFHFYKKLNSLFENQEFSDQEFYTWLFDDELNKKTHKLIVSDFISHADKYTSSTKFSIGEKKMFSLLFPADILLRYLFVGENAFHVVDYIISKVFDRDVLDPMLQSFRKDDHLIEDFLLYMSDYRHFKKHFFSGVQKYIVTVFRETKNDEEVWISKEEIDELLSSIWDELDDFESFKIPERLKKESQLMERILNFYVTFLWWFWTARGDSFYLRWFKKPLIDTLLWAIKPYDDRPKTINYYGALLYQYGKNIFYYMYATDNVRAGKQKFFIPHKSNYKKVHSNMCVLRLMDENFISNILQDINPKDLRLYVKNKKVLDLFQLRFVDKISFLLHQKQDALVKEVYGKLDGFFGDLSDFSTVLSGFISKKDVFFLKENIYSLDFWIVDIFYRKLLEIWIDLKSSYADNSILWILSGIKETLFGFMLYYSYIYDLNHRDILPSKKYSNKAISVQRKNYREDLLLLVYIREVLYIGKEHEGVFKEVLGDILHEFLDILRAWISLDDNKSFMKIVLNNWQAFVSQYGASSIWSSISGEDVVWFRGLLKNISYYNKRFLIPK